MTKDSRTSAAKPRSIRNTQRMIERADPIFALAFDAGVMGLSAKSVERRLVHVSDRQNGTREVVDFVRCSYLGLDNHPAIIAGAIEAIADYGSLHWSCARTRLNFGLLSDLEENLSDLFQAHVITFSTVLAANLSAMPILASGYLTGGEKPLVVFDRLVHATLAVHKPLVAAETTVLTIDHNDVDMLEQICRANPLVAFVCDGLYSMGGAAPIDELLRLQRQYGLFLYIDDAHGISLFGFRGEGYARSSIAEEFGDRTIIAASLGKGFGASGALLMLGSQRQEDLFRRFALAFAFSVSINLAGIGGAIASANLHRTQELLDRQIALGERIKQFDAMIETEQTSLPFPIRTIMLGDERAAISAARRLLGRGLYTSAIFFPTVAEGRAGLRVCPTASHLVEEVDWLGRELRSIIDGRAADGSGPRSC
ncbi:MULTISPECIES: aminotransferase class I/II-fold pyridoxal phosphate-dependent enzyme [unclassified Neorhizobium]|uniref:aminotransferase class I/II-fold pyridoxal phosphate-dependent enzyme n=1 Tax=unclassified Neorhizobium TaxID=2629175 RepID=UPI001FF4B376|nr:MULTISPECIES: aminotransferase class I/II-fold pyridoxal phosphate-dependent enzyme [unclassified Neorhizobium]MCJ9671580.1 aminotransferase class I/II-fold pyridoxal phosphate-dependent enzyme [Neorhizobium sp. SHOUNA12B]MCJ9745864.1 aminotransferase class I/II-fold pyridoxal phosphate-dependent enzyme [Neorhizobium sp. SHOUNA12A]